MPPAVIHLWHGSLNTLDLGVDELGSLLSYQEILVRSLQLKLPHQRQGVIHAEGQSIP